MTSFNDNPNRTTLLEVKKIILDIVTKEFDRVITLTL